jgi:hypothetical protein
VAAEPELLWRGKRARRSGGECVSEEVGEVAVHDAGSNSSGGGCVSDEVGEVAVWMIRRNSRRGEQFGGAKLRREGCRHYRR